MTRTTPYRYALPVTGVERFDVWAPEADAVELVWGGGASLAMGRADEDGWWRAPEEAPVAPDVDYGYRIDGRGPFPDPRSRRQPDGVHELSRTFDPSEHEWADRSWTGRELAGAVIYELHLGTFTPEGTLDAAAGKLEHLRSIGVDFVELLPVNAVNGTHNWGYDGVLWYAVHEPYGGPAAYQRFVDAAHRAGIGVVQDVVYNHLGPSGNYLPEYGPYLTSEKANTWGSSLNLDGAGSDVVRGYIIDNALMWLRDYHVDALRLDAVHALSDVRAVHVLEEMAAEVAVLSAHVGRPLTLIAESDLNDPRLITPREAGGYGLDAQWSDDFHHAVHVALTGETTGYYEDFASLGALAKVLTRGFFHDGTLSTFRGRHHGRPVDTERMPTWRLVVCSQNHDQIGNRAIGDRLTATLDEGRLAIAATLTLLGPFTPMLFMGEEWAASTPWQFFTSHPEKDLGEATAKGRIEEFARMGWDPDVVPDPQDPETFLRSRLDWAEALQGRHARILSLYRELAAVRRRFPELTDPRFGSVRVEFDEEGRWLTLGRGRVTIAVNVGSSSVRVPIPPVTESLLGAGEFAAWPGDTEAELGGSSLVITLSTSV
ncbi:MULTISPECIES: malto-oligosyltrehalose trehalohydrolase [unclassified Rathayibacter]|uniref:malto-oligosyltrehalose trehalohydrolase n=1 Tax=unclassified Rathayibacter TaxID=2609250 RepID=UPI00188C2D6D|nr:MULTISPECIES: malto-oligosyltrehalose trehalohydrolase [unclassified Rathayibacter]MBF4462350.1 malto-oligosyltrehalose trehalohydrolase [Rathayibacter sp. VKM Ac-2879]MBF4503607.1 malto-oligosyltrehalose trehalohydrolase [Rathayibacter sp. VKM Ac-2878]